MKMKMKMTRTLQLIVLTSALVFMMMPTVASAYIGPGLGVGALASVLGILAGLLMLVIGVAWYPLKRLYRYLKSKK